MSVKLERLKYLRILQDDGSYYGDIPLAIDAKNVAMKNGNDLQSTIGNIDYTQEEDITTNLRKITTKIEGIDDDITSLKNNKADSTTINNRVDDLATYIEGLDLNVNDLKLYQDNQTGYVYVEYKGVKGRTGIPVPSLKSQINQNVEDYVSKEIEKINNELPITVYIDSTAGNVFINGNIYTILTAYVYKGNQNITSSISNFTWKKYDEHGILDESWTKTNVGNVVIISPSDITRKAVFKCQVETEN